MRTKQGACIAAALLTTSLFASGCGESGYESVFLYVINGYPGTEALSIIGPSGTIATDVQFGDRMAADGPCPQGEQCVPIEVDRSQGTNFTYRLESMIEPVEIDIDLFAMYPQETGTLVVTRRAGTPDAQASLLRHVQTISSDCSLTFINGLSLTNNFLGDGFNNYAIVNEFRFEDVQSRGYLNETDMPFLTECGPLPAGENEPDHVSLVREDLVETVSANPWFLPTSCGNDDNSICWSWGVPVADDRSRIFGDGSVIALRTTPEYYACVQAAITIKQPEGAMPQPFPPADAQVQCPDDPIEWEDVQVDAAAVAACQAATTKSVETLEPAGENETQSFFSIGTQSTFCDSEFRTRSVGQDIIFGPESGNNPGSHQNGSLVRSEVEIPVGSQHFWVLLGRPVNPILWQWDSGDSFVDLGDFPYKNGQQERIGDYDWD